jgi:hypothetical protein
MELKLNHSDTDYEELNQRINVKQECTDSGHKIIRAINIFALPPGICGLSAWNLLRIALLMPRILRCLLDYCKICGPLLYASFAKIFNSRDHFEYLRICVDGEEHRFLLSQNMEEHGLDTFGSA